MCRRSNAGAGRNKRIFSSNGKWIGYRDDAGWNIWKNISGLRRDAKGRIVFYREKYEDSSTPRAISYDSAGRVSKVESVYDEETDYTLYYYNSKGLLVKAVKRLWICRRRIPPCISMAITSLILMATGLRVLVNLRWMAILLGRLK